MYSLNTKHVSHKFKHKLTQKNMGKDKKDTYQHLLHSLYKPKQRKRQRIRLVINKDIIY